MSKNTITSELKNLLNAAGLPELGPGPRQGVMSEKELNKALDGVLKNSQLPETSLLIRGLVLLWHDQFDPAHEIAQSIENPEGSFLHGILHRREPDYGNATYWFRRVGRHECFPEIAKQVGELLRERNETALEKALMPNGEWGPYGFIGLCQKSTTQGAEASTIKLLREIQAIESTALLEHWAGG